MAFVAELIDSSMGMMYGTLLSPLLIIMGFDPFVVVPAILLSQALAGFIASMFHNKFGNAEFRPMVATLKKAKEKGLLDSLKKSFTRDFKIVFVISALGVIATIMAVLVAVNLPKFILKIYIGILVFIMGLILLSKLKFRFTWKKMFFIGLLSSFNKGLSGGGFGPVVTSGQIIAGNGAKASVAATTLAEAPICLTGFLAYALLSGFNDWNFLGFLALGAIAAAPLGALLTSKIDDSRIRPILGILAVVTGLWTLIKVFF